MRIFITGGTGFTGRNLTRRLAEKGHTILVLTRSKKGPEEPDARITYIQGESIKPGPWQEYIKDCDIIINLAGATIFSNWNKKQKKLILESRVKTTQNVVQALRTSAVKKVTLLSASAIGYYGFHEDEELDESAGPGDDFLASVTQAWETEALKAREKGARVVIARFGIVLGEKGGALSMMAPFFKLFIGGPLGKGRKWFSLDSYPGPGRNRCLSDRTSGNFRPRQRLFPPSPQEQGPGQSAGKSALPPVVPARPGLHGEAALGGIRECRPQRPASPPPPPAPARIRLPISRNPRRPG